MKFKDIIGNDESKEYLQKCIKQNTVLHSYLFVGTEGIGKALIAKETAKKILCIGNKEDDCNCKSCLMFENNNNPDFTIINDEENDVIKIETIRTMTEKVYEKPIVSNKKVYIINNCDKMTVEAQNCLLKTLEEPPEFIVIILITSNANLLLNTIKSRCMTVKFNNIPNEELLKYCLQKLNYSDVSENLLKTFDGSIGRAVKAIDFKENYKEIEAFVDELNNISIIDLFNYKKIFEKDSINDIFDYLIVCLYSKKEIQYLNCIAYINECALRLKSYSNFDMTIDNLLIKMWEELNENSNRH